MRQPFSLSGQVLDFRIFFEMCRTQALRELREERAPRIKSVLVLLAVDLYQAAFDAVDYGKTQVQKVLAQSSVRPSDLLSCKGAFRTLPGFDEVFPASVLKRLGMIIVCGGGEYLIPD